MNEPFAVDIEFQEYRPKDAFKWDHRIGRIAIVNTRGQTIYDTYVRYDFDETIQIKMPPARFGVTYQDISIANGAKPIRDVQINLNKIMLHRTIVGHGMRLDVRCLKPELKGDVVFVDTQNIYGQVALPKLSVALLDMSIQDDFHSPVEDAIATMLLYLRQQPYQKRINFQPAPFTFEDNDFPTLGSATSAPKHGKPNSSSDESKYQAQNSDSHSSSDANSSTATSCTTGKRGKGRKRVWEKLT